MKLNSVYLVTALFLAVNSALSIRFSDRVEGNADDGSDQPLRTAVFALGSFWRSEASFGCLKGVVRTASGYSGGSKAYPSYRNFGDHAECVQLIGNLPEEELKKSTLATKLNGYAAELCPPEVQNQISSKINDIVRKGWPILRDI